MIVLVDYNLKGYVVLLQGTLAAVDWLDLNLIRFVMLEEVGLAVDSSDPEGISPSASASHLAICSSQPNANTDCKSKRKR